MIGKIAISESRSLLYRRHSMKVVGDTWTSELDIILDDEHRNKVTIVQEATKLEDGRWHVKSILGVYVQTICEEDELGIRLAEQAQFLARVWQTLADDVEGNECIGGIRKLADDLTPSMSGGPCYNCRADKPGGCPIADNCSKLEDFMFSLR